MSGRMLAGVVAAVVAALGIGVLLVPVVLRGEAPSSLEILVAGGEMLLLGFVLRTRRSPRVQSLGFWLLVVGLVGMGAAFAALWIGLQTI
jgi:hypothetical protein